MNIPDFVALVRDLHDNRPEVLEHMRVWAGLEDPFVCSDIEKEEALRIAEGLGLVRVEVTPSVTPEGRLAIEYARSYINDSMD